VRLHLPAVLPDLRDLTSRLQRTKVLVCPDLSVRERNASTNTSFCLESALFSVKALSAKGSINSSKLSVPGVRDPVFKVFHSKRSVKVYCRLVDMRTPTLPLDIQLARKDESWSLERVSIEKGKRKDRRQRMQLLHSTSILVDRCSFMLSNGRLISMKLRRLPSSARVHRDDHVPETPYQISVGLADR
jgi:hypothetical protein